MELLIKPDHQLKEVQEDFQKRFPFLKIEFFKPGEPASPQTRIDESMHIGSIIQNDHKHQLIIDGLMRVRDLEKEFHELFGINAQVFRKSGNVWLQTSATDHWTLTEQNLEGHEADKSINEEPEDTDYHEQE